MEKKLQVKNLTVSFRTVNGKVQAVRDISFDLYKGETLAIVGESGSGKSVTSRAILGILAGNALVEGGEIIYEDKDLLKIDEEDFHAIRGDEIAMIFQDPMSSLNPIMRIGRQLTEAMLLKNKAARKSSRKQMETLYQLLEADMNEAIGGGESVAAESKALIEKFRSIQEEQIKLEGAYRNARENAMAAETDVSGLMLEIEKRVAGDLTQDVRELADILAGCADRFVVREASALSGLAEKLKKAVQKERKLKKYEETYALLKEAKGLVAFAGEEAPDFFSLAYYLKWKSPDIPEGSAAEIDAMTRPVFESEFLNDFTDRAEKGVRFSFERSRAAKKEAVRVLAEQAKVFEKDAPLKEEAEEALKAMEAAVLATIDKLAPVKDSQAYTFKSSSESAWERYDGGKEKNKKEEKRFVRQSEKLEKLKKRGKNPDWKVVPPDLVDLSEAKSNLLKIIEALRLHFEDAECLSADADLKGMTLTLISRLRTLASNVMYKLSKSMAKARAVKLMEEVGIPEAATRFRQYPFQFSGGMRQRIVIAIALSANPDVLICDEPTTALDVTIQSQILELINKLKEERNLSVIFITHDLGVVANMADRICVMYAGKIVEYGTSLEVFLSPAHPYTWALLSSIPELDTSERLETIPGTPPNMIFPPKGDAFAPRNQYALEIDFEEQPPMFQITDTHYAATWLLHPEAPAVAPPPIVRARIAKMMEERGGEA